MVVAVCKALTGRVSVVRREALAPATPACARGVQRPAVGGGAARQTKRCDEVA